MTAPLVSVLMTAYNREKYIAEAIESVLASSFADLELIIVDDASADCTAEIACRYTTDSRVQVHVNERNLSDYVNRNCAASYARGKYLKYLDSDDIIYPYALEVIVGAMERFPDAGLGIERPPLAGEPYPVQISSAQAYREHFVLGGLLDCGPSGTIIKHSAFSDSKGFSGEKYLGDTDLWLRLAARYPVVKFQRDTVWWRRHAAQEMQFEQNSLLVITARYELVLRTLSGVDCPLSSAERERAIRRQKFYQARRIWRLALKKRSLADALRVCRGSGLSLCELARGLRRSHYWS